MTAVDRTLRVDAARNRDALLVAAEDEFAERGLGASVADIARRAGVAKGTVFRHFANKEQLIAAVVVRYVEELTSCARTLRGSDDPEAALFEFLTFAASQRRQRDLTLLLSLSGSDAAVADITDQLHGEIRNLLDSAQKSGAVRTDVTEADVFLMMCAPVHVVENLPGAPDDLWRRYLGLMFDGLRPAGASPLPRPAPVLS